MKKSLKIVNPFPNNHMILLLNIKIIISNGLALLMTQIIEIWMMIKMAVPPFYRSKIINKCIKLWEPTKLRSLKDKCAQILYPHLSLQVAIAIHLREVN